MAPWWPRSSCGLGPDIRVIHSMSETALDNPEKNKQTQNDEPIHLEYMYDCEVFSCTFFDMVVPIKKQRQGDSDNE